MGGLDADMVAVCTGGEVSVNDTGDYATAGWVITHSAAGTKQYTVSAADGLQDTTPAP